MKPAYFSQWNVNLSESVLVSFMNNIETILRLGPQWNVKKIDIPYPVTGESNFTLEAELDRAEITVLFEGYIEVFNPGKRLSLVLRSPDLVIDFSLEAFQTDQSYLMTLAANSVPLPATDDLREFEFWARSIINYLKISESKSLFSRIWKWFLDRYWLKMTQFGKRMVFFIVVADGFSVAFLVVILIFWKFLQ